MIKKIDFYLFARLIKPVHKQGYQFSAVSWKRIKQQIFIREKYFKQYSIQSGSHRVDQQKFKIYITPRSPQVIRTGLTQYQIVSNQTNFNLTFLDNLDYMGKQFTWNNRKNFGLNFKDILKLQKLTLTNPVTITQHMQSSFNNEINSTQKQLTITMNPQNKLVKILFSIYSSKDGDKWLGSYEISYNEYSFLVKSAKDNIYYATGLKSMIQLQKKQIIRLMEKRVLKDQQKPLKSSIQLDSDMSELLSEMEDDQPNIKSKQKK